LWDCSQSEIIWINDNPDRSAPEPPKPDKIYFGVFTCKGGSENHCRRPFSWSICASGFNVALVDLDPEKNLQKLIGDGRYLPKPQSVGESISL
jgi:hypothetical protein